MVEPNPTGHLVGLRPEREPREDRNPLISWGYPGPVAKEVVVTRRGQTTIPIEVKKRMGVEAVGRGGWPEG